MKIWRRIVYYFAYIVTFIVLMGIWWLIFAGGMDHSGRWIYKILPIGLEMLLNLFVADAAAIGVCRWFGLSLVARDVQTIRRETITDVRVEPPLDILLPKRPHFIVGLLFSGLTLLCVLAAITTHGWLRFLMAFFALFWGAVAVSLAIHAVNRKPALSSNAEEISMYGDSVRWEDVEFCDFVTERNVFGKITYEYPVLRDREGKEVLTLKVGEIQGHLTPEERDMRERLPDYLSRKLTGRPREAFHTLYRR